MGQRGNMPAYNSLGQFRSDSWSALEETASRLAHAAAAQRPGDERPGAGQLSAGELAETVRELLERLEPAERCWAFPGPAAFQTVQRLFAAGKYDRLAATVARLNRALVTESYRSGRAIDLGADDDADDLDPRPPD